MSITIEKLEIVYYAVHRTFPTLIPINCYGMVPPQAQLKSLHFFTRDIYSQLLDTIVYMLYGLYIKI